jgi:hypothetical protein
MKRLLMTTFGMTIGLCAAAGGSSQPTRAVGLLAKVDHLVFATPDLATGVEKIQQLLGVRATPGGEHPGAGTRNALIALGEAAYLEIIGPDPEQPKPERARRFGIDNLVAPKLVTWAAKGTHLEQLVTEALRKGIQLGDVSPGSRRDPQGVLLNWRVTLTSLADGIVPFFIDWGETSHPARTAARGASLVELRAEHPDAERVQKLLNQLGLELPVTKGQTPALVATITGPRGRVELR